jgi:hypothetical protein
MEEQPDLIDYIGFEESMLLMHFLKWLTSEPRKPCPFTDEQLEIIEEAEEALLEYERKYEGSDRPGLFQRYKHWTRIT